MSPTALYDYHIHDSYSRDAPTSHLDRLVTVAEDRGLEEICITTHLIVAGKDTALGVQPEELPRYFRQIEEQQADTPVRLRAGLEVDYFPDQENVIRGVLEEYPLDFALGSVHIVNGVDVGSSRDFHRFFKGRSLGEAVDEYSGVFVKAAESGLFDVMAHTDYWKRFLLGFRGAPVFAEYGSRVAEAVEALAVNRVGFEVNTAALRIGYAQPYPIPEFISHAFRAGVEAVTIGSDTHAPETLGYRLDHAVRLLLEAGYSKLSTLRGRRPVRVPLRCAVSTMVGGEPRV